MSLVRFYVSLSSVRACDLVRVSTCVHERICVCVCTSERVGRTCFLKSLCEAPLKLSLLLRLAFDALFSLHVPFPFLPCPFFAVLPPHPAAPLLSPLLLMLLLRVLPALDIFRRLALPR